MAHSTSISLCPDTDLGEIQLNRNFVNQLKDARIILNFIEVTFFSYVFPWLLGGLHRSPNHRLLNYISITFILSIFVSAYISIFIPNRTSQTTILWGLFLLSLLSFTGLLTTFFCPSNSTVLVEIFLLTISDRSIRFFLKVGIDRKDVGQKQVRYRLFLRQSELVGTMFGSSLFIVSRFNFKAHIELRLGIQISLIATLLIIYTWIVAHNSTVNIKTQKLDAKAKYRTPIFGLDPLPFFASFSGVSVAIFETGLPVLISQNRSIPIWFVGFIRLASSALILFAQPIIQRQMTSQSRVIIAIKFGLGIQGTSTLFCLFGFYSHWTALLILAGLMQSLTAALYVSGQILYTSRLDIGEQNEALLAWAIPYGLVSTLSSMIIVPLIALLGSLGWALLTIFSLMLIPFIMRSP